MDIGIMSLQNLAVTVNGLKQNIELETTRLSSLMNANNSNLSKHHARFAELLGSYSAFAVEYKFQLETFHKSLLNDIQNQQEREQERLDKLVQERLETLSNKSNLEIVENVEETEYSSANSVSNDVNDQQRQHHQHRHEVKQQQQETPRSVPQYNAPQPITPSSIVTVPAPKAIKAKRSIPFQTTPKPKQPKPSKKSKSRSAAVQKVSTTKSIKKKTSSTASVPVSAVKTAQTSNKENINGNQMNVTKNDESSDVPYKYNASTVQWRFNGPVRSSTVIYIGNIPNHIQTAAVQFFIMHKAKVTMWQIEETKLRRGARGKYALVRFRRDISVEKIQEFIDRINRENAQLAEEKKKAQNSIKQGKDSKSKDGKKGGGDKKDSKQKKVLKTSWQTRVFLRFNHNFKYYENEDAMYSDDAARHTLFIRNFDVLDRNCHKELTETLLAFGDLYKDIEIYTDSFGDPYCIVIFKYINEAIYCCNSEIHFKGRMLELRYSQY